ncbi:MAG: DUF2207 domain-containing protein [Actinobacteria bacterium]|nr:DUF2207 domain-containing protein [Actinomycetota bacterium]
MTSQTHTRWRIPATLALGLVALVVLARSAVAQAGERIARYDVDIRIEASGSILVTETIEYNFDGAYRHGIFRDIPVRLRYDDRYDRVYPLHVLSVEASAGTPAGYELEDVDGSTRIRVGDPDRTITGRHVYTITYRVDGSLNGFRDHDELYWNAVGADWEVPVERATARVTAPAGITGVACFGGPVGSTLSCSRATAEGGEAVFSQKGLYPYEAFTVVVAIPKGAVPAPKPILEERWSLPRAFEVTPATVSAASALLLLLVGGFAWLVWRAGRDRRRVGSQVDVVMGSAAGEEQTVPLFERGEAPVEFAPPDGLRPGQVGTLIDEAANPLDVSASIVDLAVRGYLVIEEIPKEGWFGKPDWRLVRRKAPEGLLEYERLLLEGLFEDGSEVELSELRTEFSQRFKKVQDALYDEAVAKRWFARRPDKVRRFWSGSGTGILLLGGGLVFAAARWTHLGLVPIPIVVAGFLLLVGARWMPRRTAKGTGLTRRVLGFRRVIEATETDFSRFLERENLFSKFLPYAIVFGCTEKWAERFAAIGEQPDTSWYVSTRPVAFAAFSDTIDGFTVTTAGTITSTPAGSGSSGFGGGGFSGGGGGGGGGGSW